MKRIINVIALFTFSISYCLSQYKLSGKVMSASNLSENIPNVTISLINKNFYQITDEQGIFSFECSKCIEKDSLKFSSIGFNSTTVAIVDLKRKPIIYMEVTNTLLDEVKVKSMQPFDIIIGNKDTKIQSSFGFSEPGSKLALFIPNYGIGDAYITKVRYFFKNGTFMKNNHSEPFKIKVYSKNSTTGEPKESLLKDEILARATKSGRWFEIDLSQYNIKYPSEGVFVGMEILNTNEYTYNVEQHKTYDMVEHKKVLRDYVAIPHLGGSRSVYKNLSNWRYFKEMGSWKKIGNDYGTFMMGVQLKVYEE